MKNLYKLNVEHGVGARVFAQSGFRPNNNFRKEPDSFEKIIFQNLSDFKEGTLELYSLSGNLIKTRKVTRPSGTEHFDLSGLASGSYVLVFYHQSQRIGQQILIKK